METLAQYALEAALDAGASFADVRIENTTTTIIEITNGISKTSSASRMKGAGIRAFIDGAWGFVQTTDLTTKGMKNAGLSAAKLAVATRKRISNHFEIEAPSFQGHAKFSPKISFNDVAFQDKIEYVKAIDAQSRTHDSRIVNTRTIYGDLWTELCIFNSFGTSVYVENSLPRIISISTSKEGGNRQRALKSFGARGGYEAFQLEEPSTIGTASAEQAIRLLDSTVAKGGIYDVILDPVLNGVMVHEAFGHACEADNWPAHTTVLEDKVGEQVGPEHLSISDDPTLPGIRGSFEYDWEGTKTQKHTLVKDGILTDLLHSLETASRLESHPNGAARAQSFSDIPIPRMSNTFMEPGTWTMDELLEDTKSGLLLCSFNCGYTDPSKGQFMFQANHGFIIENGEVGTMIRDVSLAGQILDILQKIDAVGKDFKLDSGTCGKSGQMVPDTSGGPHARIRSIPVGGV